jgi:poly(3-hydroxybutyrate) depolymerase
MKSARAVLSAVVMFSITLFSAQVLAQGTLEEIRVFSPALEGNLEGNDPERGVFVYLPPGYANSDKRYPVVYFLHGYGVSARVYCRALSMRPWPAAQKK